MTELLVVCTANRCRSPMAEALLGRSLKERGLDWAVSSAGVLPSGSPVVSEVQDVMMSDFGLDLSAHRSRRITPQLIDAVDLVLCMERRHLREVVTQDRSAFARTFTVKEFLRRAELAPPDGTQSMDQWIRLLSAGRTTQVLMGRSTEDDIVDPIGYPEAVFRATAQEIATAMDSVASVLSEFSRQG